VDCIIVVDNSNVFIEGRKLAAARKGVHPANPADRHPVDPSWRIDFSTLLLELRKDRNLREAILVGSRPPPNDNVWKAAEEGGFKVTTHARDMSGKEKAVDTDLVAQGTEAICDAPDPGVLVIASGDRDFIPLVNVAHRRGWTVEMASFQSAFSPNGEMAITVDLVRPLDTIFHRFSVYDYEWRLYILQTHA
jgi:uncharacterized LabA/DUF88 family protein